MALKTKMSYPRQVIFSS